MGQGAGTVARHRRRFVTGVGLGAPALLLPRRGLARTIEGGFSDTALNRGHHLRGGTNEAAAGGSQDGPGEVRRRYQVIIVGAGVAGLAAARALRAKGVTDYCLLELDDVIGGNSRSSTMAGLPCPTGAHYLPLPGAHATEVRELLTEVGVRDQGGGYDERMLCHSPQERLFIHGVWQDGVLPLVAQPRETLDEYRRFSDQVDDYRRRGLFAIPSIRAASVADLAPLQRSLFDAWLVRGGYRSEGLRWYLDYCCRDDYGAGIGAVSAWAGLHYFASRHGLHLPDERAAAQEGLLTWPEGNAWLVERMARPHRDRIFTGMMVRSVAPQGRASRGPMIVDVVDWRGGSSGRWQADWVIWAAPAFLAARVLDDKSTEAANLRSAAGHITYAPWAVANLLIDGDWRDESVAMPAWDNVIFGSESLGYVDARHQRLDRKGGTRLWTWYHALDPARSPAGAGMGDPGGASAALSSAAAAARRRLLARPWRGWVDAILNDLGGAHPLMARHLRRVDVHRWGHAMPIPAPGLIGSEALEVLRRPVGRFHMAHGDLAGYSIFEESLYWGMRAGADVARRVG